MFPNAWAQFQTALDAFIAAVLAIIAGILPQIEAMLRQLGLGAVLFAVLMCGGAQSDTLATWAPLLL